MYLKMTLLEVVYVQKLHIKYSTLVSYVDARPGRYIIVLENIDVIQSSLYWYFHLRLYWNIKYSDIWWCLWYFPMHQRHWPLMLVQWTRLSFSVNRLGRSCCGEIPSHDLCVLYLCILWGTKETDYWQWSQ